MRKLGHIAIGALLVGAFVVGFIYNPLGKAQSQSVTEATPAPPPLPDQILLPSEFAMPKEPEKNQPLSGIDGMHAQDLATGSFNFSGGVNSDEGLIGSVNAAQDLETVLRLAKEEAAALIREREKGPELIGAPRSK